MVAEMTRRESGPSRSAQLIGLAAGVVLALGMGCSRAKVQEQAAEPTPIGPEAFAAEPSEVRVEQSEGADQVGVVSRSVDPAPVISEPVGVSSTPSVALASPLEGQGAGRLAAGLELVEAKVGDINGKPIFISSFFAPIEDRLIANAQTESLGNWRRQASQIIAVRLDGIIQDELLRAEALAALSTQQRQGLRAFLQNFRRDLLSENLGSSELANRRIESETGQSLEEALEQKEIDTLVGLTLYREINRRINVSWRDIQQRYERDFDVYNPNPSASFRLIRVSGADEEAQARIAQRLDNGEDFAVVATDPANIVAVSSNGQYLVEFEEPFSEASFFGSELLNEQARSLSIGETVGPFDLGSNKAWLTLERIDRESLSLYDAQLRINQELTRERRGSEQQAYVDRLIERARVTDREVIGLRLLGIAEERYGPGE